MIDAAHEVDESISIVAAESLSWLEVNVKLARRWVEQGQCDREKARAKLQWMYDRINLPGLLRDLALPRRPLRDRPQAAARAMSPLTSPP